VGGNATDEATGEGRMSTFGAMKNRIADELARSDLSSQISLSVQSAVQYYEHKSFWFNESRSVTFNTVAAQEFYTSSDEDDIPNLLKIHHITVTVNSNRYKLEPRTYQQLEEWAVTTTSNGSPTDYAYYAQQLRLYPIPDAAYAIRISALVRLTALSADNISNAWMTDGESLIRSHAKWDLYTNVIKDSGLAQEQANASAIHLARLQQETSGRLGTGFVVPTYF